MITTENRQTILSTKVKSETLKNVLEELHTSESPDVDDGEKVEEIHRISGIPPNSFHRSEISENEASIRKESVANIEDEAVEGDLSSPNNFSERNVERKHEAAVDDERLIEPSPNSENDTSRQENCFFIQSDISECKNGFELDELCKFGESDERIQLNETERLRNGPKKVPKKKRQRRNPVWPYFEVRDGIAYCKQCSYSTKSVFSTNLKVHLRTHHPQLFEEVRRAEEEQSKANQTGSDSIGSSLLVAQQYLQQMTDAISTDIITSCQSTDDSPNPQEFASIEYFDNLKDGFPNMSILKQNAVKLEDSSIFSKVAQRPRRLRRHPVWNFFIDTDNNKIIKCLKCDFQTGSAYSTNLKMHLKAHHKHDYELVTRLEDEQRKADDAQRMIIGKRKSSCGGCTSELADGSSNQIDSNSSMNSPPDGDLDHTSSKKLNTQSAKKTKLLFDDPLAAERRPMTHFEQLTAYVESETEKFKSKHEMENMNNATNKMNDLNDFLISNAAATNVFIRALLNEQPNMKSFAALNFQTSLAFLKNLLPSIISRNSSSSSPITAPPTDPLNLLPSPSSSTSSSNTVMDFHHNHHQNTTQSSCSNNNNNTNSTKCLRTVNKKLPTGEVVKIRSRRNNFDDHRIDGTSMHNCDAKKLSQLFDQGTTAVVATHGIQTTNSADTSANKHRIALKQHAGNAALMNLVKAEINCFQLLDSPEFKEFIKTVAPDYELPCKEEILSQIQFSYK